LLIGEPEVIQLITKLDGYKNTLQDILSELTGPQAMALANEQFLSDTQKLGKSARDFAARVKNLRGPFSRRYMGSDRVKTLTKEITAAVAQIESNGPLKVKGGGGTIVKKKGKTTINHKTSKNLSVESSGSSKRSKKKASVSTEKSSEPEFTDERPTI